MVETFSSAIDFEKENWTIVLEKQSTAPLRESGRIAVNFTARVFPTPMRESQSEAEEEVRRSIDFSLSLDRIINRFRF